MPDIIAQLLQSPEPSIRYKVRVGVLGEDPASPGIRALQAEIRRAERVRQLLSERDAAGRIEPLRHPYNKWRGAHWVLATLADIGYPPGDPALLPVRDQVLELWLGPEFAVEYPCVEAPSRRRSRPGVPVIRGRARRCASQQGNALYAVLALGLADARCEQLVEMLLRWQWPDGGWNCDRRPEAHVSSFWESLTPLRALALYARLTGNTEARRAAARAAEIFLRRGLYRRERDGQVMNPQFVRLHYPCYWHYDILFGLKVMAEAGHIADPRCAGALDLLESKRLPDGGWPAEERFYSVGESARSGRERVSWGAVSIRRMNEWVTADALTVLRAAGRLA